MFRNLASLKFSSWTKWLLRIQNWIPHLVYKLYARVKFYPWFKLYFLSCHHILAYQKPSEKSSKLNHNILFQWKLNMRKLTKGLEKSFFTAENQSLMLTFNPASCFSLQFGLNSKQDQSWCTKVWYTAHWSFIRLLCRRSRGLSHIPEHPHRRLEFQWHRQKGESIN